MMLRKGKMEGKLKESVECVERIDIKIKSYWYAVSHMAMNKEFYSLAYSNKIGIPEMMAIKNDRYMIYPLPDRRYQCRIIAHKRVIL